jgi:hypothetical protein
MIIILEQFENAKDDLSIPATVTLHRQKPNAPNFWRKLRFKHEKNHEGKS